MPEQSIRQKRKAERAGKTDKYGFSMTQSRRERRSLRRSMLACCYMSARGTPFRIEIGSNQIKDNHGASDHWIYGGGSRRAN
jgi:hypothetical protein